MQNKGIVIFTAVLLTLASIFYLSFSVATNYYDEQAAKISDPIKQQDYKDSVKYLGIYSYQKCLETQIGLGLDLKGGMNVILEISVPDVVEALADHKTEAAFVKSMEEAKKEEETSQSDFISLFINAYHKNAPGHRLAEIFATQQLKGKVSTQSSDSEVESALRSEVQAAIDNSFNVVRNRIDKFGVVQPNIQKLEGQQGRIMVEMPGIREPERIRKLLQGSANLEFWETYNSNEIIPYLTQLDQRMAGVDTAADTTAVDSTKQVAEKETAEKPKFEIKKQEADKKQADEKVADNAALEAAKKQHPLLSMLQVTSNQLSLVGLANVRDTAAINKVIYGPEAQRILPSDVKLLWSAKPTDMIQDNKNIYELHALKVTEAGGRAPLEGDVITDATDQFQQMTGRPSVSMSMNSDGARRWAALTKANVGKAIAIVLDGVVYSAPRVNGEISGGNSEISGNFTVEDTKDLANTLKSGRMPAPARIVQEEVVGPTLGAQSIQQGIMSFIVAFVLLMIYMVLMYNFIPGMMANMALIVNLFFTLGILTSFQAALTMSGLAGMVLSLGTAVDANVLIYERTKEELRSGKNIKAAIPDDTVLTSYHEVDGIIEIQGQSLNRESALNYLHLLDDMKIFSSVEDSIKPIDPSELGYDKTNLMFGNMGYTFKFVCTRDGHVNLTHSSFVDGDTPTPLEPLITESKSAGEAYSLTQIANKTVDGVEYKLTNVKINGTAVSPETLAEYIAKDEISGKMSGNVNIELMYTANNGGAS